MGRHMKEIFLEMPNLGLFGEISEWRPIRGRVVAFSIEGGFSAISLGVEAGLIVLAEARGSRVRYLLEREGGSSLGRLSGEPR